MAERYDVVVIGSGFGGGITACRLAEAGHARLRPRARPALRAGEDFIDDPDDAPKLLWHERVNPGGMFDVRLMRDVSVITRGRRRRRLARLRERPAARAGRGLRRAAGRRRSTRAGLRPVVRPHRGGARPGHDAGRPGAAEGRARSTPPARAPAAAPSGCRSPCTSARSASTRSAASASRAARTSAAATSAARCTRRTRSTSPTSRAPSSTAPRSARCTWSTQHRPAAGAGGLARRFRDLGGGGRRQRRGAPASCSRPGTLGSTRLLLQNRKAAAGAVARARHALLRQRRRAGGRLRPAARRTCRARATASAR